MNVSTGVCWRCFSSYAGRSKSISTTSCHKEGKKAQRGELQQEQHSQRHGPKGPRNEQSQNRVKLTGWLRPAQGPPRQRRRRRHSTTRSREKHHHPQRERRKHSTTRRRRETAAPPERRREGSRTQLEEEDHPEGEGRRERLTTRRASRRQDTTHTNKHPPAPTAAAYILDLFSIIGFLVNLKLYFLNWNWILHLHCVIFVLGIFLDILFEHF